MKSALKFCLLVVFLLFMKLILRCFKHSWFLCICLGVHVCLLVCEHIYVFRCVSVHVEGRGQHWAFP